MNELKKLGIIYDVKMDCAAIPVNGELITADLAVVEAILNTIDIDKIKTNDVNIFIAAVAKQNIGLLGPLFKTAEIKSNEDELQKEVDSWWHLYLSTNDIDIENSDFSIL